MSAQGCMRRVMANVAIGEPLDEGELQALFAASWPGYVPQPFAPVLARSLTWVSARDGGVLVGFVNVATDGGRHAFLLDPTVHPRMRRRGIGTSLVDAAAQRAYEAGATWLHVDYEPSLAPFYARCGFTPSSAGVRKLRTGEGG